MTNQSGGSFLLNVRNLSVPFGLLLAHRGLRKLIQSNETKSTKSTKSKKSTSTAKSTKKSTSVKKDDVVVAPKKKVVTKKKDVVVAPKKKVLTNSATATKKNAATKKKVKGGNNLSNLFVGLNTALGPLNN